MIRIDERAADGAKPDADGITVLRGRTESGDTVFVAQCGEHKAWASKAVYAVREVMALRAQRS